MGYLDTNNFYFIFFYFSNITFLFFYFLLKDNEEGMWQVSHMTGHMMWRHKPRTWWKGLKDDVRAPGVHMVALSRIWDVMGRLEHEQFLFSFSFIFWLYRDFVFFFFFFLLDNEEAHDIAVTWCDVIRPRMW